MTTTSKSNQNIKSAILFVTSYFLIDPRKIAGGISEHYIGLYGTFIKKYSKIYDIFWYSVDKNILYIFDSNGNVKNLTKIPILVVIPKILAETRKKIKIKPLLTVVIAYHYAATIKPVSFLISLLSSYVLKLAGIINIIVDVIDPPVEVHMTYSSSPSKKKMLLGNVLDILTLKKMTVILFCSNSYRKYMSKKYAIPYYRTYVVYDGGFPGLVTPKPPKAKGPLTVFYSGSLLNVKGIPQLIESINNLRNMGIKVNLLLTGGSIEMKDSHGIKSIMVGDWFKWIKVLSEQADICVIPYPRKVHWDLTYHMKLSDYMAAGKPIVSIYGTETASILGRYKCGLIAKSWKEFEEHIIKLYKDREFAKTLGDNGRKAAEQFFDYALKADELQAMIESSSFVRRS